MPKISLEGFKDMMAPGTTGPVSTPPPGTTFSSPPSDSGLSGSTFAKNSSTAPRGAPPPVPPKSPTVLDFIKQGGRSALSGLQGGASQLLGQKANQNAADGLGGNGNGGYGGGGNGSGPVGSGGHGPGGLFGKPQMSSMGDPRGDAFSQQALGMARGNTAMEQQADNEMLDMALGNIQHQMKNKSLMSIAKAIDSYADQINKTTTDGAKKIADM